VYPGKLIFIGRWLLKKIEFFPSDLKRVT